MKMDIKILKIGLLATAAILAPVATMMIQYELREDEEHEFEGDEIELATTETATLPSEETQNTSNTTTPSKATTKTKARTGRRGNTFRNLDACLKVFPRCTSKKKKQTYNRQKVVVNWSKALVIGRGENQFLSKLKIW